MDSQQTKDEEKLRNFSCKICLEIASEPAITPCGHLYCWICIQKWADKKSSKITCPYCKCPIEMDKLTYLYTGEETKVPKRPHKTHQKPRQPQQPGFFDNVNFSFGFFPGIFSGFGMTFGNNNQFNNGQNRWLGLLPLFFVLIQIIPEFFMSEQHIYNDKRKKIQIKKQSSIFDDPNILSICLIVILMLCSMILNKYFIRRIN